MTESAAGQPKETVPPRRDDTPEASNDEINRRILRGEITIDSAISSGRTSLASVRDWQARFIAVSTTARPLEEAIDPVWRFAVRGWRKYMTVPVLVLFVLLPGAVSLYDSASKLWAAVASAVTATASEMDASELDVCNEWVARVGRYDSKEEARKQKDTLIDAMKRSDEWKWVDDVHIARDVETPGKYLLLIDMWSGPSSEEAVAGEIARLQHPGTWPAENIIGNEMLAAHPLYYRQSFFAKAYGRPANSCKYPEVQTPNKALRRSGPAPPAAERPSVGRTAHYQSGAAAGE